MRAKRRRGYFVGLTALQDELKVLEGKLEDPELRNWDESEYRLRMLIESVKKRIAYHKAYN